MLIFRRTFPSRAIAWALSALAAVSVGASVAGGGCGSGSSATPVDGSSDSRDAAPGGGGGVASPGGGGSPSTGGSGSSGGTAGTTGGTTGATGGLGAAGAFGSGGGSPTGGSVGSAGRGVGGAAGGAGGAASGGGSSGTLDIYWIDVEGGAATLLVSPSGQTLLVDAGFPGNNDRDVNRVLKVINEQVRATRLDYVVTTHFHVDHVGGVTALASRFAVGQFMDHGQSIEGGANYNDYVAAIAGKTRVIVKPGDRLQLGEVDIVFVSAGGQLIDPLPSATANPHCAGAAQMPERPTDENPLSVGFLARFGTFDFVDLGDLTWAVEDRLACPTNRLGPVDLFQVNHHGMDISSAPQLVRALAPLVAVINNGATKGGAPTTFDTLTNSPGIQDIWQVHRATSAGARNTAEALIANISTAPDGAYFIKASVARDGSYTVTHSRTGETRAYRSR